MEGVNEVGGVVAVCGASGPWSWPRGPIEIRTIRRITDAPTGPVTTVMRRPSSSSSPPPPPLDSMMTIARAPVQPGWGNAPNRGRHTTGPDDPMVRCRGLRAPSAGMPAGQLKGTGSLQHARAWRAQRLWWCGGRDWATVVPATTTTTIVAWAGDRVHQGHDQVGKFSSMHLTD
jgi:hypothetical protein